MFVLSEVEKVPKMVLRKNIVTDGATAERRKVHNQTTSLTICSLLAYPYIVSAIKSRMGWLCGAYGRNDK
jgi:hypothetical protein